MLKKRLAACVIVKDGIAVQSIGFKKYLPLGRPEIAIEFLNQWGIDEIIINDISASKNRRGPDYKMIRKVSEKCFVPLTVGGGISNIAQMRELMHCGADKICINTQAMQNPALINKAAGVFGDQCIIVSVDGIERNGKHFAFNYLKNEVSELLVENWVKKIQDLGAGEIFLNSVDRDGIKKGFDISLISKVCETVSIPVIATGGAGEPKHFLELFKNSGVSAACAGNYFHYTEHSVNYAKSYLLNHGVDIRLDTYAHYKDYCLDDDGRIEKHPDAYLEQLHYEIIPKEVI